MGPARYPRTMSNRGLPAPPDGWSLVVDVWSGTGPIDVAALQAAGVIAVIAKATDGFHGGDLTQALDKRWAATSRALLDGGIALSAYGVLEPSADPAAQGKLFARAIQDAYQTTGAKLFCPCLDWELAAHLTGLQAIAGARAYVEAAEDVLGRTVGVYTGPAFVLTLERYAGAAAADDLAVLQERPLWLADYTGSHDRRPPVPAPWAGSYAPGDESRRRLLWQASGDRKSSPRNYGTLPWNDTDVDVDLFDGGEDELLQLGC
jgi:GH25 family lysozyme M1 (1,4-beta-N-acetylmuramidase)